MEQKIKKGYDSFKSELDYWCQREPERSDEWRRKFEWVLQRAQQYADFCHTERDKVLAAWEEDRTYWFVNYYQECNQPDLQANTGLFGKKIVTLDEWMAEGQRLFGEDRLDWRFRCPMCGHIQTGRQFQDAGKDPHRAYFNCASRFGLGGKKNCKWTTGGLLAIGGRYVIDKKYIPHLIFDFDE